MTKPSSIKTHELETYDHLDLHQLETILHNLQKSPPSPQTKHTARVVRQALRLRQHQLKATVMEFEMTNSHYLLVYDSTENFSKIAGHSVLFYTLTIADRIHRRYSIKNDTDNYSFSYDGIVSIRSVAQLAAQLAEINIYPDRQRSTTELHFFKLPKVYTDTQIEKLRDRSHRDAAYITSTILPDSPLPELHYLILELNRELYYNCRRISDHLALDALVKPLITEANEILVAYLNFANAKSSHGLIHHSIQIQLSTAEHESPQTVKSKNLLGILISTRNLRNNLANIENLRLLHHRDLCSIIRHLVEIEQITAHAYRETEVSTS